ncbi:hypothetical protein HUE87_11925 [Candidatus Sulfurimonas marisnigri]|uniref:Uncharacterized protein n=2 Tax=Candidatus Sulfurimonas marisnigri TaxID=2740405 RepID=A0A7S7RRR4_9BACT|nr:hypothetical protein HUE87_11925 [Candidatus Sulfurimonas marisnigri]
MWLTRFKIAIIEKNIDKLNELMEELPKLEEKREIEEAIYLLREASELIYTLKDETSASMKLIKKNLQFLRSTDIPTSKKLDIKL